MPRAARYTVLRVGGRGDGEAGGADGLQAARAPRVIGKAQRRSRSTTRSRYMDGPRVLGSCPMDADRRRKIPGGLAGSGVACGGHRGRYPRRPLRPGGVQRRTDNRNTLRAPVAQWIEQRFPKSGGGVRGRASRALRVFGAGADRSQTSALIRARPHVVGVRVGVNWDAAAGAWSSRRARLRAAASGARATTPNDPGQRPVGQTLHS